MLLMMDPLFVPLKLAILEVKFGRPIPTPSDIDIFSCTRPAKNIC
jgi:hypothetical protein